MFLQIYFYVKINKAECSWKCTLNKPCKNERMKYIYLFRIVERYVYCAYTIHGEDWLRFTIEQVKGTGEREFVYIAWLL